MSEVLSALPAANVERKKRARRQAANSFLSSISLGSSDSPGPASAIGSSSRSVFDGSETDGDDPSLAQSGWADPDSTTPSVLDLRASETSSIVSHKKERLDPGTPSGLESASPSQGDSLQSSSPLRSMPMSIPTTSSSSPGDAAVSGGTIPMSSSFGPMSFNDRADRISIAGRGRTASVARAVPYVHLDSINGLRGTPNPRLLLTMPPATDRPGSPFAFLSYLGFQQKPHPSARTPLQPLSDNAANDPARGASHEAMFRTSESDAESYNPLTLDELALRTNKHHQVINLPSILGSIIRYTRPNDLRKTMNENFRQAHPDLDPSMTLSKLQRIKEYLIEVGEQLELEAYTIACAFVLFERLLLKHAVVKTNRHAKAAACLMLAVKMGDLKETQSVSIPKLAGAIEKHMQVSMEEINQVEFTVLEELEFDLNVTAQAAMPHLLRILTVLDYSGLPEYLGPAAYAMFQSK